MLQDWVFWIDFSKIETCLIVGDIDRTSRMWPSLQHLEVDLLVSGVEEMKKMEGTSKVDCVYFHYTPISPSVNSQIFHATDSLLEADGLIIYWEVNQTIIGRFINKVFGLKRAVFNGLSQHDSQKILKNAELRKIEELVVYPSAVFPKVIAKTSIIFRKFSEWSENSKRNYILSKLLKNKLLSRLIYFYWPVKLVVLRKNNMS